MLIEMKISALAFDPTMNMPLVILKSDDGKQILPIWIGMLEAGAIAAQLEKIDVARPMTHDLLKTMVESLGGTVDRVVISDLTDNTYFARVFIKRADEEIEFDARPSDSMALALRTNAKIFADEGVVERSRKVDLPQAQPGVDEQEKWREILENMDPEDFGKYKM
ncbi:MAG: bifunctional nuclease family protein [Deltaproteobacteria bacterium]|nr:bifunctional nuclease family protein [Deltaproteobacteria bacterium]